MNFFLILILSLLSLNILHAANIGLLVVATGKYIHFVPQLLQSADAHFCKNHCVTYFVFTDHENFEYPRAKVLPHKRLGWPLDTLRRFDVYLKYENEYKDQEYLFAIDADMLFVDRVGNEVLNDRTATIHPGFYNKRGTYETNKLSLAYVAPDEGKHYVAGGFYGGTREEFISLLKTIIPKVDADLARGIFARWHDESHLNRYFIDFPPTIFLSPAYCYPESWKLPFKKKLLALDKNHSEFRN